MVHPRSQQGISLVTTLIMLTVLSVMVVASIRSSSTTLKITNNTQRQQEVTAAARQAIENFISTDFTASLPTTQTAVPISVSGGTSTEYTALVDVPSCLSSVPLNNADLDPTNPNDAACMGSDSAQNTGLMNNGKVASSSNQWCYTQSWDVAAAVTDSSGGATVKSHQGISERVIAGTACP